MGNKPEGVVMRVLEIDATEKGDDMNAEDGQAVELLVDKIGDLCNEMSVNVILCALSNMIAAVGIQHEEHPLKVIGYVAKTVLGAYSVNMPDDDVVKH